MPRVELVSIVSVRDVDPPVPRDRVRIDGLRGSDAVLPLLLHLGMHDEQGVVREVDRDLARHVAGGSSSSSSGVLGIGSAVGAGTAALLLSGGGVPSDDAAHAKLARDPEGERSDDGPRAEIRQLVAVPPDALLRAVVAVDEGGVGGPRAR